MNRRITALAIFAGIAGQIAITSSAQAQTGATLTGRVVDSQTGEPVAEAMVVVTSNSLQGEQSVTTDATGFYRFPGLPAGIYTVQIFHGTHLEYTVPNVELRNQQTTRVNGRLVPRGTDVLEVEVEVPSVGVGSSSVGASVDAEFTQRVPIMAPEGVGGMTRSFEALAQVSPGAQDDGFGVSVSGTTSAENQHQIDGVSVGSPAVGTNSSALSVEFIDEVNIVDGGYMPEFGRSIGGAITATTKSGGNETHDSVCLAVNPGAFGGEPELTPTEGNALLYITRNKCQADAGFMLGGAFIHDNL